MATVASRGARAIDQCRRLLAWFCRLLLRQLLGLRSRLRLLHRLLLGRLVLWGLLAGSLLHGLSLGGARALRLPRGLGLGGARALHGPAVAAVAARLADALLLLSVHVGVGVGPGDRVAAFEVPSTVRHLLHVLQSSSAGTGSRLVHLPHHVAEVAGHAAHHGPRPVQGPRPHGRHEAEVLGACRRRCQGCEGALVARLAEHQEGRRPHLARRRLGGVALDPLLTDAVDAGHGSAGALLLLAVAHRLVAHLLHVPVELPVAVRHPGGLAGVGAGEGAGGDEAPSAGA
mmetsp:Transcript_102981/g.320308  ORF Transcript_102981/g.320308 Transcript_102981/m.320308 type:complete len:287 (-) Transcript_102981:150-1010(-)